MSQQRFDVAPVNVATGRIMKDQADHICVAVTHRYTVKLNRLTGGAASEVQPPSESLRSPLRPRLIHPARR